MNKTEREELRNKGFTILRAQHDARKDKWKISRYTPGGGWTHFSDSWFITREDAEQKIDEIMKNFPETYAKD